MPSSRCLARWFGCLFVAVLLLPQLAAEAQVRVPHKSKNTATPFSPPASSLTQPTVDVPANATIDYTGRAWECKHGYRRAGTECVAVPLPANATIDYTGHAWECERGYRRAGKECVVVPMLANATWDYIDHVWECKHGYRRAGTECVVVPLPANASIDYTGHAWECKYGYRRVGNTCEKMTAVPTTAMYGSSAVQESRVNRQQHNDSTEAIRHIQAQLKKAGFDPGPLDGILGPRTMKALHRSLATR